MRTFGEMLRMQRQKLGLTQKQVADAIGMSDAYICSLESEKKTPPPYYTVSAIADVLQMDAEILWKTAIRYREKQAVDKIRRRAIARKGIKIDGETEDEFIIGSWLISDNLVNAFFSRPEVCMSALGLFHKQPADMTIDEKRVIYHAINKAQEFLNRSGEISDASEQTE